MPNRSGGQVNTDQPLARRRRQYMLYCPCRYAVPTVPPDVADQVAVRETASDDSFGQHRLAIYDSLYHDYLSGRYHPLRVRQRRRDRRTISSGRHARSTRRIRFRTEFDRPLAAERETFRMDH